LKNGLGVDDPLSLVETETLIYRFVRYWCVASWSLLGALSHILGKYASGKNEDSTGCVLGGGLYRGIPCDFRRRGGRLTFSTRRKRVFFVPDVPFRRLPVITNLVEYGEEVRGLEIFVLDTTFLLFSIGIVVHVSLAVGYVMSMLLVGVVRPMMFAGVGCMSVKLVKLIAVWGTVLGRGNKKLSKSGLLLRLLLAGTERRGWQREWRTIGAGGT
jgi:hypothetical protein